MKKRLLIAEDDLSLREGLIDLLEGEGYEVVAAQNGREAMDSWGQGHYALVLLDVMMPEKNGFVVCQEIRKTNPHIPVLFLTAKGEEVDQVVGLRLGGDDYVTKPFSGKVLLARIEALMRRCDQEASQPRKPLQGVLGFAGGEVDLGRYMYRRGKQEQSLTAREVKLLETFAANPGQVLDRNYLLNTVWGIEYYGTTRTLDQHIVQLRKKIEPKPHQPKFLLTVHGVGYRYEVG
ncbi:MAG: response regulator transcription factor [Opitutales bacterium]|nr:response regulator transcription factor [Opitutales bacterium]MCH8541869.1 response regulator transcription factor [Opitutales bacterium]